ncbi:MAG TPA: DUF1338 domain-containing protein [Acidobacteriota bacterium]|nr:DUF1338 domain-containing protein [bacterium]HNX18716.1 DUF1338 domain-containing protein [Acidobacteriota bacterium]
MTQPTLDELFAFFWRDFCSTTPDALRIHHLLEERGETVANDHVAFRTFNIGPLALESVASVFARLGYMPSGEYRFEEKKLRAMSFRRPSGAYPHVFVSELLTEEFSEELAKIVRGLVAHVPESLWGSPELFTNLPTWPRVSYLAYRRLLEESEYAGWLAAFGLRVNHFTVSVNALKSFASLEALDEHLVRSGFRLNESGGAIKGSPRDLLEQSSTLACRVEWEFAGGDRRVIPSCYYEFAKRYVDPATGELYPGFVAKSADKIFESTDTRWK